MPGIEIPSELFKFGGDTLDEKFCRLLRLEKKHRLPNQQKRVTNRPVIISVEDLVCALHIKFTRISSTNDSNHLLKTLLEKLVLGKVDLL